MTPEPSHRLRARGPRPPGRTGLGEPDGRVEDARRAATPPFGFTGADISAAPRRSWRTRVGDRFGTKRTFLFALVVFSACSALCGAARSAESLIAIRLVKGVGGGVVTPVGTAMLFRSLPCPRAAPMGSRAQGASSRRGMP